MASTMKKLLFTLPALLVMGCSVQKDMDCCNSCDEYYPFTNCPDTPHGYYLREYKQQIRRSHYDYSGYYPNTQTVYFVPTPQGECVPDLDNGNRVLNTPRPERLGEYRDNGKTDVYGNRLQPNQYPTRDASGQRGVGDVTRPNAPRVTKD